LPKQWPLAVLDSTREHFEVVRRVLTARDVTSVICATDAGREGELIFRFIYQAAGCRRPVSRLWISSLTEGAIREGLRRLRPARDFDALADAALARSRADWLVGMNLSRAYGLALDAALSVGRVQTPTLAMLVERELAIRDFVPEDYLEVAARFEPKAGERYSGVWFDPRKKELGQRLPADGERARAIVERALSGRASIASVSAQTKKLPAPLCYDLTELQRHMNRLYGLSAQRTLEVAQSLYERHKLISYPRTDSRHLSSEVAATLPEVVRAIAAPYRELLAPGTGERPLSQRFIDDRKVTDHHAILPTATSPNGRRLSAEEGKLYDLVCRRLLQAWHADFVWSTTTVITEIRAAERADDVDSYRTQGTSIEQPGWKVLEVGGARAPAEKHAARGGEAAPSERDALPTELARGQKVRVLDAKAVKKTTRPPPPLTDATLLTAMETAGKALDEKELSDAMKDSGLGTPATRASIIETLLARGFAVRDAKSLRATERGIGLIGVVDAEVKSPAMTGAWEAGLQAIARGQGDLPRFMQGIEAYVVAVVGRVPPVLPPLPGGPGPNGASHGAAARSTPRRSVQPPSGAVAKVTARGRSKKSASGAVERRANATSARSSSASPQPSSPPPQTPSPAPRPPSPRSASPSSASPSSASPSSPPPAPSSLATLLSERFGFAAFRPHQQAACEAAAAGRDVLLVMPTGAGKSLCYQLPGLARGGTTLVISPLIALMEDQVTRLQSLGLRAARIHSGRPRTESRQVCLDYVAGALDYLFVAPERLGVSGFPELLARRPLALVAIDEAHCISQWGHDFRPDYRLLGQRLPLLRPAPIIALTATATPIVQRDIVAQLGLGPTAQLSIHGFRRHNLALETLEVMKKDRAAHALEWLSAPGRLPAIVYAQTRQVAEQTAQLLATRQRAAAYHAGMSAEARESVQTAFLEGRLDAVVATVAFGMGVDKADIRTVLHLGLPGSVEGYYQEIGRAGRDGKPSRAVLMHHAGDRKTHEFFLRRDYPEVGMLARLFEALGERAVNAQTLRRKSRVAKAQFDKALEKLWIHGGVRGVSEERLVRGSEGWREPYAAQRALREQQLALMVEFARGQRCRMLSLVEHFGDQHDAGTPCGACDVCAPAAVIKGQRPSDVHTALSDRAARTGKGRGKSSRRRPAGARASSTRRGRPRRSGVDLPATGPSAPLVAALRAWRLQESKLKRVPAFRVLTNRALVAIAEARPSNTASLRDVAGVGPKLLRTYGDRIVAVCVGRSPRST
jgi:DNA topoisomerase-3